MLKRLAVAADRRDHLKLLRKYVSRNAAGKGRAVLEGVELDSFCFVYVLLLHHLSLSTLIYMIIMHCNLKTIIWKQFTKI